MAVTVRRRRAFRPARSRATTWDAGTGAAYTPAKNTDLGKYKVYVKGTPETGEATSAEITVKVVAP